MINTRNSLHTNRTSFRILIGFKQVSTEMRFCRFCFYRINSFIRENKFFACALFTWALIVGLIVGLILSLDANSSNYRKRSSAVKNDELEKPMEEENPAVITSFLYEAGHKMPLNDVCPKQGEGMKLMILVMSSPRHVSQRNTIRSTWGSIAFRRDIGLAFMLGISNNSFVNKQIERENRLYGDIIQGMFIDTYNNLTLKTISTLEWSWTHCSRVQYVLKTDDDVYIHTPVLLDILDEVVDRRQTIMGYLTKGWKPIRNMKSHYYISKAQFQENKYPEFHTGPAYVLTSDIVEQLYRTALNATFFKLEDIFITGMIANNQSNIKHGHYPQFLNSRPKNYEMLDTCAMAKLAAVHELKKDEMFDLWKRLSDGLSNC